MSEMKRSAQVREIVGRIGGDLLRAYARTGAWMGVAVARNIVGTWLTQGSITQKLTSPARWAWGKVRRIPGVPKPAIQTTLPADIARLLTMAASMLNEAHAGGITDEDPERGRKVQAFLENLDLGEIMEMVDGSGPHVLKAVETFNEELWKYPAKVGTLVATLIPLVNIITKSVREVMIPIEKSIGPDLLADILLSLVRGINGADTADLVNTAEEVLRRVHTGNLLLGKGSKPLLQIYLTDVLKDCLSRLDPELLHKTLIILAEDRLSIARSTADALTDNPDITAAYLASLGSVRSSTVKGYTQRLRVYEDLDGDRFKAALSESLSDLDTYEIAELINTACRVLNRVQAANPGFLPGLASGVVDSLDEQEVAGMAQWLIDGLLKAFKPLAPALVPIFVKGFSELMKQEDGYDEPKRPEAILDSQAAAAHAAGGDL